MALSGDDITTITGIFKSENEELYSRLSTELDLKIEPIKETLVNHIKHDERNDAGVNESLGKLEIGQTKLTSKMNVVSYVGGLACTIFTGVTLAAIKDLL